MIRPLALSLALVALPGVAGAQCYADYKAKQDNPLRLHYGVVELRGACAPGPAAGEVAARIGAEGWELLNIVGVFGSDGLEERRDSAGPYFLRF